MTKRTEYEKFKLNPKKKIGHFKEKIKEFNSSDTEAKKISFCLIKNKSKNEALTSIMNDIISGKNRADDVVEYLKNHSEKAVKLHGCSLRNDQWIKFHDQEGNRGITCFSGDNFISIKHTKTSDGLIARLPIETKVHKSIEVTTSIDGAYTTHGFLSWSTAIEVSELALGTFVTAKLLKLFKRTLERVADGINEELEEELAEEFEGVEEVDEGFVEDISEILGPSAESTAIEEELGGEVLAAVEDGAAGIGLGALVGAIVAVYVVAKVLFYSEYVSNVVVINDSKHDFALKALYLDNVDENSAENIRTVNLLKGKGLISPNPDIILDEGAVHYSAFAFHNHHRWFANGLGALLEMSLVSKDNKDSFLGVFSLLHSHTIYGYSDNGQSMEFGMHHTGGLGTVIIDPDDHYKDYGKNQLKTLRIKKTFEDKFFAVSQMSALGGVESHEYNTVVIIGDLDNNDTIVGNLFD